MTNIAFTGERFVPTETGRIAYEHYHRYAACLEAATDKVVADIASGEGYGAALLAERAKHVFGIDINADIVAHARDKYSRIDNLSFAVGDCRRVPFATGSVDLIVSFETIEHIAEHDELVEEFVRILRPNGSLIISSPNKEIYGDEMNSKNEFHVRELTHNQFIELFRRHFQFVHVCGQRLGIASFVLDDDESEATTLKSFMKGERGTALGFQSMRDATYSLAICAHRDDALPDFGSSIHLDPGNDLFREQEKTLRWASTIHQEQEGLKRQLEMSQRVIATAESSSVVAMDAAKAVSAAFEKISAQHDEAVARLAEMEEMQNAASATRKRAAALEDALHAAEKQASRYRGMLEQAGAERVELERALAAANQRSIDEERKLVERAAESARSAERDKVQLHGDLAQSIANLGLLRRRFLQFEAELRLLKRRRGVGERIWAVARRVRRPRLMRLADTIRHSGIFDIGWYLSADSAIEATGTDPILHYIQYGWREGRDPHLLFSVAWYLQANPDVADAGAEPLSHYLLHGAAQRRDPHPLFDNEWYSATNPDIASAGIEPLSHYLSYGAAEGRDPHPLFDNDWYLETYPDVAATGLNPLLHYVLLGAAEGRNPNPLFRGNWYLAQYPDVAASGEDPLQHYLRQGVAQGRDPHPLFSTSWYLDSNPDVAASGVNPLEHFVRFGAKELRSPHPFFDAGWYAEKNPDAAARGDDPLTHYLQTGMTERRDPHPAFSTDWYLKNNPDAEHSGVSPLEHYLTIGLYRCATPNPRVTREQCERLLRRLTEEPNHRPTPADLAVRAEKTPPRALPTALQQFLNVFYEPELSALISALYDLLGRYGEHQFSGSDLRSVPELAALVDELSRFSRAISLPKHIDATIIIPVHNQVVYTLCCLKALLGSPARSSFEIIVADDLSSDATASAIGKLGGIIRHNRNATNLGFTRNCNAAASLARGDTIVFLNNDTIPLPNWLDELVDSLRADPSIGLVGSKLLGTDGLLQEAGGIVWQDGSAWNFGRGSDATSAQFNYLKDVDYISGAAIAVRKSVWIELGGFDEIYAPAYCEDTDFAFRVRAQGLRTVYQPFSAVIHHEGVSHGRELTTGIKSYQVRNNQIFIERWKDVLSRENFPNGTDVPLARDRSRNRPHILVIDHYVPQPDRDAGSRTINHYLKLFQAAGLQVSFWPQNRYFDRPYAEPLQRLGIEIHYDLHWTGTFDEWLEANGSYLDYVFLSRAEVAIEFIDKLRAKTRAKMLFYGHDIHFRRLEMEFAITGNPATDNERIKFSQIERAVWAKSDVIYYLSTEECDFVRAEMPSQTVRVMPVFIYSDEEIRNTRERLATYKIPTTRQLLFIGGFRHRPNVDAMLWFVRDVWPVIASAVPHVQLCIAGSFPPPQIEALAGGNIVVTGAISDIMLRQLYLSSQVAIVPLRFGGGVKGKVLEALSYGTPVVTTLTGAQGMPEAPSYADICDSAEEFGATVVEILKDPGSRLEQVWFGLDFVARTVSEAAARRELGQDVPELKTLAPCHGSAPAGQAHDATR